jgi:hypothetical protein
MRAVGSPKVRGQGMAAIVEEFQTRHHAELMLQSTSEKVAKKDLGLPIGEVFSSFDDKLKYTGFVPSGRYLDWAYMNYMEKIRPQMDLEVKKRDAERIAIDVSYKQVKELSTHHGKKVFHGLVTLQNNFWEISQQLHGVTDSHDQYNQPLLEMKNTLEMYNHTGPGVVFVDNPRRDRGLLLDTFPSIRCKQEELDQIAEQQNRAIHNNNDDNVDDEMSASATDVTAVQRIQKATCIANDY